MRRHSGAARRWTRLAAILPACLAAALAVAGPASAGSSQESIFQDDAQLLWRGPAVRELQLDRMQALGVDTVRVVVSWTRLAPSPQSRTAPAGFDGSDPADYPASSWNRYDELVRSAQARGLRVILNPSGPAPAWASRRGGGAGLVRPEAAAFARFVETLGKRFGGSYADEDGGPLPRVGDWSVWNEGNVGTYLQPQWATVRIAGARRRIPASPSIYRKLYRSAYAALQATGHGSDRILLGETAPRGNSSKRAAGQMDPGLFLRELFCLDGRYRPFRGSAAKARGCRGYRKLAASGFAHHPYFIASTPTAVPRNRDEFPIGNTRGLTSLLDRAAARGRVNRLDLAFTEFGVQSNPPDRYVGAPLTTMTGYMNVSEYLAYRNPRVRAWSQYLMNDDPLLTRFAPSNPRRYGSFQTGLRFEDDRVKPALDAYRLPIAVNRLGSSRVEVFGELRPAPNGTTQQATVEFASTAGGAFGVVADVTVTNPKGYFTVRRTVPGAASGRFRIRWRAPDGTLLTSRSARAERVPKGRSR